MPYDSVRNKMLARVMRMMELSLGKKPTPQMVQIAGGLLDVKMNGGVALTERDLQGIAAEATTAKNPPPKSTKADGAHMPPIYAHRTPTPQSTDMSTAYSATPADESDVNLIVNTSKRQRKILADKEWARIAEEDRVNARVMSIKEKEDHLKMMLDQRRRLDGQRDEHDQQKERERQERERQKEQMNDHIRRHRELTRAERDDAFKKALDERHYREEQQKEMNEQRARQRAKEHDEQVRQAMILEEQLRIQKETELNEKLRKQNEWRAVLNQNEERMRQKTKKKEDERAEDREYQRMYRENQERLERERREFYARKDARQKHFQQLADGVAELFNAKEQDLTDKIEEEYAEQLRRRVADDEARKSKNKNRMLECLQFQEKQIKEKQRQENLQKEADLRLAEEMRKSAEEFQRMEEARKIAARQEALRMRQFLNTQLQMAHFKETQEPETSIMRPADVATSMYSPQRSTSRK